MPNKKDRFEISHLRRRENLLLRSVWPFVPRGGVILWYFHTYIQHSPGYFWGFKILNFNILGGFQKTEYYEDFVDTFLGSSQNWTIFRGHFDAFKDQGTEWRIFFGFLTFQIFIWGAWNSWYFFFLVTARWWARAYVWRKKWEYPPWGLSISPNLPLLNAYKWAFVLVGFCPSGLLS